jgi:bifunctional non-homologous end joining protein LigD
MAAKEVHVSIEDRVLKLSNLDKILFPYSKIIKAELIQYYQQIAVYILPHLKDRPLTLIRFPEGIDKIKFYSKNKADWTPDWIDSIKLASTSKDEKVEPQIIDYVMANNITSLVWMANLAAIELHAMTVQYTKIGYPNMMIFDLDPPEHLPFDEVKKTAVALKDFLIKYDYNAFLKTSGSKGLHIYIPIKNDYTLEDVINRAKALANEFISQQPNTTLSVNKDKRINKILIDIFRNNKSQTCVVAYSVRGKEGAPISAPIFWEDLPVLTSSQHFNINNIFDYLKVKGDPWKDIYNQATPLNTTASSITATKDSFKVKDEEHNASKVVITDSQLLEEYATKRNFDKTTEPIAILVESNENALRYVIQKHNASNLHYDLRLEHQGLLLSWAIPKALPNIPGEKRMAIETEPHPMKYLNFEGIIPKEEYGGGEMWVFDTGDLQILKREEHSIKFRLSGGKITGNYKLYRTEETKWLIEKTELGLLVDSMPLQHMLCNTTHKITSNYFFEIKWDGIRVMIKKVGSEIVIYSKSGKLLTDKFPDIVAAIANMDCQVALLDGEIVCLNSSGIPNFANVISRMHLTGKEAIARASTHNPATCYLFDMIYLDGIDTRNLPIEKRRAWLQVSYKDTQHLRFSQSFEEGQSLLDAIKLQKMEGIICKKKGSTYQSNNRSEDWLKLKVRSIEDAIIIGYTKGSGDRSQTFGSLILAQYDNEVLVYKGKVGSGFTSEQLREFAKQIKAIPLSKKMITDNIDEESQAIWLVPTLWCEIQIATLTDNNTFREPVFIKMRSDI